MIFTAGSLAPFANSARGPEVPTERLSMREIREALHLRSPCWLSKREIAAAVGVSRHRRWRLCRAACAHAPGCGRCRTDWRRGSGARTVPAIGRQPTRGTGIVGLGSDLPQVALADMTSALLWSEYRARHRTVSATAGFASIIGPGRAGCRNYTADACRR